MKRKYLRLKKKKTNTKELIYIFVFLTVHEYKLIQAYLNQLFYIETNIVSY